MKKSILKKNQRGQGLIEYLIILALMGAATIGITIKLNQTVRRQFVNVIYSLQGGEPRRAHRVQIYESDQSRRDFSNFLNGSQTEND